MVNFHASGQKSKHLHFDRLLSSKAYKDLDEKVQNSYVMTLTNDAKFEEKPTLGSKKRHEEFGEFQCEQW